MYTSNLDVTLKRERKIIQSELLEEEEDESGRLRKGEEVNGI